MTPAPRRGLRAAARPAHDRWLVSYADLVTLLLAFFTTLYAASTIDSTKLGPLTNSLNAAFDPPSLASFGAASTPVEATALRPEGVPTLVIRGEAHAGFSERMYERIFSSDDQPKE